MSQKKQRKHNVCEPCIFFLSGEKTQLNAGQDKGILRTKSGLLCETEEHDTMRIKVHETGC